MTAAIDGLLADRVAAQAIGAAGRRFVIDHHAWQAMLAPLAGLIMQERQEARHAA
jgi:hypothetical protein